MSYMLIDLLDQSTYDVLIHAQTSMLDIHAMHRCFLVLLYIVLITLSFIENGRNLSQHNIHR